MQRYGYIASQPEGQIAKVRRSILDMAFDAAVRGGVVGLLPVAVWLLVGPARRRELAHLHGRTGIVVAGVAGGHRRAPVGALGRPGARR